MVSKSVKRAVQVRVGLSLAVGSLVIALVNFANALFAFNWPIERVAREPSVVLLLANGILFGITLFWDRPFARIAQVILVIVNGLGIKFLSPVSNLASTVFITFAIILALKYELVRRHLGLWAVGFLLVMGANAVIAALVVHDQPASLVVPYLVATAFTVYLFWMVFAEELRMYTRRNEQLEEMVEERTKKLRETNDRLEHALADTDALAKELAHRVRNNLAIMNSIVNLQLRRFDHERPLRMVQDIKSRIQSMSLVYTIGFGGEHFTNAEIRAFIDEVVSHHSALYSASPGIVVQKEIGRFQITVDQALYVGLIVGECIANSLTHAFVGRDHGTLLVRASKSDEGRVEITVADDGVGLPKDVEANPSERLGMWLITSLAEEQLKGSASLSTSAGTRWRISFPA